MKIRIAKKIAKTRKYSRRKAEELIFNGLVKVNNITINTPASFIEENDIISINGEILSFIKEEVKLWIFNKPRGIITSKNDPANRKTIYNIMPSSMQNLLYVGRLDYNSEGILLLTNNGNLVNELTLAKNKIERVYKVKTFGKITNKDLLPLEKGLTINGIRYNSIKATIIEQSGLQTWLSFVLTEGKNNEIRKICEFLNLKVSRLIRISFGPFELGNLASGTLIEINKKTMYSKLLNVGISIM